MSSLGDWIKRKRFATAGHVGELNRRLAELSAQLGAIQNSATDTREAVADTREAVGEIVRTTADTREAAAFSRRALELFEAGTGSSSAPGSHERKSTEEWFNAHYTDAADQVLSFISASGLGIGGREVADVGSGDGIIDLALATRGAPLAVGRFRCHPHRR